MTRLARIAPGFATDVRRVFDVAPCSGTCRATPCVLRSARAQGTADEWFRACDPWCVSALREYVDRLVREQDAAQLRIDMGGAS